MISLVTIKRSARALKNQLPLLSEIHINQKRNTSSYDHFLKYGAGGRLSFNGNVATVFGATGFLGRYVVNRLAKSGTQIVIPYRGTDDDVRHLRVMGDLGQIVFLEYDIRDKDAVARAMSHSNVAINLIGKHHATRNFSLEDVHINAASTIASAAASQGVDNLVHVSSLGAKGNSPSKVYQLKAQGERVLTDAFPQATVIRPAECYGHEDDYFNRYAYLRKLPLGVPLVDGGWKTTKRPVYIADVAQGIVNATLDGVSKGRTYELYGFLKEEETTSTVTSLNGETFSWKKIKEGRASTAILFLACAATVYATVDCAYMIYHICPEEYYLHDLVQFIFKSIRKPFRSIPVPSAAYSLAGFMGELSVFSPRLTRDQAIRQFLTEEVGEEAFTFEDLNITPCNMNTTALTVLRRHRDYYHHDEIMDEENDFCPPVSTYLS